MIPTDRQQEQYRRFQQWASVGGVLERPILLDTYMKPHQQKRLQWLREHARGRIAEVGMNWGYVLAYVGGHAGVDINPALVELARVFAPHRDLRIGDACALPWDAKSFDTVLLTEVLEHLEWRDVFRAVEEALRVAAAQVLITIPDGNHDTEDATSFKHRWLCDDGRADAIGRLIVERTGQLPFCWNRAGFWLIRAEVSSRDCASRCMAERNGASY